ncbi:MAG: hypothetical protein ACLTTP_07810 [Alistipes ihumii]
MNIRLWSLTVAWLLFAACSDRNAELAPDYFSGEIAGTSDSLVFRDCATSVDYLLSEKGAYRAVAARYGRLAGPRRRVYLACRAHLDSDTVSAGSAVRRLVVDRLIAFGEAGGCDWQYQLSGVYESDDPRHRQVLRLRPDRTFLLTRFGDGTESHTTGSWGLASELVLLLDCEAGSRISGDSGPAGVAERPTLSRGTLIRARLSFRPSALLGRWFAFGTCRYGCSAIYVDDSVRRVLSGESDRRPAAWRIFVRRSVSVCVLPPCILAFLLSEQNVLPAASRAGFRIPVVGDRRFVGLFGGLLAFIRFFLPKVLRCRLTDGFRSWNCGQAMRLPYARRGNDGRRRVLSRNRPRLFCAMAGLAPCPFLVKIGLSGLVFRNVTNGGFGCLGIFRLRRSRDGDGETVSVRPASGAGPDPGRTGAEGKIRVASLAGDSFTRRLQFVPVSVLIVRQLVGFGSCRLFDDRVQTTGRPSSLAMLPGMHIVFELCPRSGRCASGSIDEVCGAPLAFRRVRRSLFLRLGHEFRVEAKARRGTPVTLPFSP